MVYIKMFGAKRSAARFTGKFISTNLDNRRIKFIENTIIDTNGPPVSKSEIEDYIKENSKLKQQDLRVHNMIKRGKLEIVPIVVIKNPYTWYKSIRRFYKKRPQNIDWEREYTIFNLLYKIHLDLIGNPKNKYDDLYSQGTIIRYEDLLSDPEEIMKNVSNLLEINHNSDVILPKSVNFNERVKEFYLSDGPWKLSPSDIKRVNDNVDWNLMSNFGYEKVKPEDFYDLVVYEEDDWTFAI